MESCPQSRKLDVHEVVEHYRQVRKELLPFETVWSGVHYVWRWENYGLTLTVLCLSMFVLLFPTLLMAVLLCSCLLLIIAGLWHSQTPSSQMVRPKPNLLSEDSKAMEECIFAEKRSATVLAEYKLCVERADGILLHISATIEYLRSIIFWQDVKVSLSVMLSCVALLLLMVRGVPVPIIMASLLLLVFCCNSHFFKAVLRIIGRAPTDEHTHTQDNRAIQQNIQGEQATEVGVTPEVVRSQTSAHTPSEHQLSSHQTEVIAVNRDLHPSGDRESANKKDALKAGVGACFNCQSSFANLLKRKHQCNKCGHLFCGSCTVKVPRASLGATSPAAFEETVRVCVECNRELGGVVTGN